MQIFLELQFTFAQSHNGCTKNRIRPSSDMRERRVRAFEDPKEDCLMVGLGGEPFNNKEYH